MSSRFRSLRGRTTLIGQGLPQDYTTLDPAAHEGSIVYTTAGQMRYSDGTNWVLFDAAAATSQGTQGVQGVQGLQGDYGPGFQKVLQQARRVELRLVKNLHLIQLLFKKSYLPYL